MTDKVWMGSSTANNTLGHVDCPHSPHQPRMGRRQLAATSTPPDQLRHHVRRSLACHVELSCLTSSPLAITSTTNQRRGHMRSQRLESITIAGKGVMARAVSWKLAGPDRNTTSSRWTPKSKPIMKYIEHTTVTSQSSHRNSGNSGVDTPLILPSQLRLVGFAA
ncbi:uncharacterized protein LACBIDRAFT_320859 [Laccaria bicolor S238N-H82]|uniref:Predicted protein n=1 Tax=Laccaria bicolor (strain S238N-H82 / ATCC MYA-4686) TaxID=486041 RepID=B0CRI4_LACBS|nr:uncharacterized protein LACBIDRAFT_320859 [Laccaria bicolor S238N-H82]EDR15207.1 predicted protein [Laccaria bicolor S238N-H82]|eukprot:XP_001873415.1 predicted protein [Laccaria bicolor S238N-H82]